MEIKKFYSSLDNMLAKYERRARKDAFCGNNLKDWEVWRDNSRQTLKCLLGLNNMESCALEPILEEVIELPEKITREKVIIQVEPAVWMPMYILIPQKENQLISDKSNKAKCFIALPGHMGAGKYSVAGCREIPELEKMIEHFNYDYGYQLAKRGYVTICPDCRGFGERRDEGLWGSDEASFLNSTCFQLSHMAEGLGQTVAGMCTFDVTRLIDYLVERDEWDVEELGCMGFSGGGMQTLWAASLDDRIKQVLISGYLYGYRDSLLILNGNCSCNYIPHLWEHFDMGDIASLIAPRPLIIQSCEQDHLNGPRGIQNVYEQIDIIRKAYSLYSLEKLLKHDIRQGDHCFHAEVLDLLQ